MIKETEINKILPKFEKLLLKEFDKTTDNNTSNFEIISHNGVMVITLKKGNKYTAELENVFNKFDKSFHDSSVIDFSNNQYIDVNKCSYSISYLEYALKILRLFKEEQLIDITVKADYPIKLENKYMTIIIAPCMKGD